MPGARIVKTCQWRRAVENRYVFSARLPPPRSQMWGFTRWWCPSFCLFVCSSVCLFVRLSPSKFVKSFARWQHLEANGTYRIASDTFVFFLSVPKLITVDQSEFLRDVRNNNRMGLGRTYHAHQFIFSFFSFTFFCSFRACGRLSWLHVSVLLHLKYTVSYRIVSYRKGHPVWRASMPKLWHLKAPI